jgi:hypothetical protein
MQGRTEADLNEARRGTDEFSAHPGLKQMTTTPKGVPQAATARRPKLRYLVGRDARVIKPVRAVTPVRVTEAGVRKVLRG